MFNAKKLLTIILLFATQATMIAATVNRKPIPAFKNLNETTTVLSPVDWKVDQKMPVPFAFPNLDVILMSIHATSMDIYHGIAPKWNQFTIKTQTILMIVNVGESIKTLFQHVKLAATDSYNQISLHWNLFHEKTHAFMIDAVKPIKALAHDFKSTARAAAKNLYHGTTSKIKIFANKIHPVAHQRPLDACVGSPITFWATLVLQWAIFMIIASTMVWILLRAARTMILHQAMTQNVLTDSTDKIFDMDLSAFGYNYEITNVFVVFDSIDFLCSVNYGIDLCGSCTVESQFIGPAFLEMRDPQLEFDDDDDDDESTDDFDAQMQHVLGSFSKLSSKDDMSTTAKNKTVSDSEMDDLVSCFAKLSFQDRSESQFIGPTFAKMRDPHDGFDDDDDDQATKDLETTQREDLLGSFSKLSSVKKAVSASEMDDLVSAFANL